MNKGVLTKAILLCSAVAAAVIAVFCNALYDWGTACARRWGWDRIVNTRERMRSWALPFSRILMILIAIGCLIALFFVS